MLKTSSANYTNYDEVKLLCNYVYLKVLVYLRPLAIELYISTLGTGNKHQEETTAYISSAIATFNNFAQSCNVRLLFPIHSLYMYAKFIVWHI